MGTTDINDPSETNASQKTPTANSKNISTLSSTLTTSTITTTSKPTTKISPTAATTSATPQDSVLITLLRDQGPQAIGISLASLAYTALAAMPYWLPAVSG